MTNESVDSGANHSLLPVSGILDNFWTNHQCSPVGFSSTIVALLCARDNEVLLRSDPDPVLGSPRIDNILQYFRCG